MVSLDKDPEKARQLLAKKKYQFTSYQLAGTLPSAYQVPSIPTTYVISPEGKIVFSKHGLADYALRNSSTSYRHGFKLAKEAILNIAFCRKNCNFKRNHQGKNEIASCDLV